MMLVCMTKHTQSVRSSTLRGPETMTTTHLRDTIPTTLREAMTTTHLRDTMTTTTIRHTMTITTLRDTMTTILRDTMTTAHRMNMVHHRMNMGRVPCLDLSLIPCVNRVLANELHSPT